MDLSKAFDNVNHDLLVKKSHAYGIRGISLILLKTYLSNRFQRTKLEGKLSTQNELLTGVPQGSVKESLLFNVYLKDLFYNVEYTNLCNIAVDTTPHSSSINVNEAITNVEHYCKLHVDWFRDNHMTLIASRCHLLVTCYKDELMFAKVGGELLWEDDLQKYQE